MPKYRLKAACGWIANSEYDGGEKEFDTEEEAQDAAWEMACERIESWVELIEDEET